MNKVSNNTKLRLADAIIRVMEESDIREYPISDELEKVVEECGEVVECNTNPDGVAEPIQAELSDLVIAAVSSYRNSDRAASEATPDIEKSVNDLATNINKKMVKWRTKYPDTPEQAAKRDVIQPILDTVPVNFWRDIFLIVLAILFVVTPITFSGPMDKPHMLGDWAGLVGSLYIFAASMFIHKDLTNPKVKSNPVSFSWNVAGILITIFWLVNNTV